MKLKRNHEQHKANKSELIFCIESCPGNAKLDTFKTCKKWHFNRKMK
jgi:hypothetical protein